MSWGTTPLAGASPTHSVEMMDDLVKNARDRGLVRTGDMVAVLAGAGEVAALLAGGVLGMLWLRISGSKGAKLLPYKEKSAKDAAFDPKQDNFDLSKLPANKNAPLVVFCNAGECWKSYKAAVVARDAGYKQVHWFRGGMPEWTAKGLPTQ